MPPETYPPDDPRQWLNRAQGDLAIATFMPLMELENIFLDDLCYHPSRPQKRLSRLSFCT